MSEDKGKKPEEETNAAPLTEEEAAAAAIVAKKAKKKKLIIMVGGAVVLLGIIVGGLTAAGVIGGKEKTEEHAAKDGHDKKGVHPGDDPCLEPASGGGDKKEEEAIDPCKPVYVDVPDIIVNLVSDSRRAHFANVKVTLEIKGPDKVTEIENNMPRIVDSFNTYLREMTKDDLEGSEGLIRLEDEMMLRLNKILPAGTVTDILFKSVIVQ